MSNTATVATIAAICAAPVAVVVGIGAGAVALGRWLAQSIPEDRTAVECLKEELRRELLLGAQHGTLSQGDRVTHLTSASLHIRSAELLRHTAERLGYRIVRPVTRESQILLARPSGERLAIGRNAKGQVTVTARDERYVKDLVRCHTADRAIEHLRSKGMKVETQSLPGGEIRITGQEPRASHDGAATVTTQVHSDGSLFVDVDNIRGNRCESIVSELSDAVGGDVSDRKPKSSHRLPVFSMRRVRI